MKEEELKQIKLEIERSKEGYTNPCYYCSRGLTDFHACVPAEEIFQIT